MARSAVSNASPLIVLQKSGLVSLLSESFEEVFAPEEVAREVGELPAFVRVAPLEDRRRYSRLLEEMDPGEAAAISLAVERRADAVVLDDLRGRRGAKRLGLRVVGTLGLVLEAKRRGTIASAGKAIEGLRRAGLYLDERLAAEALRLTGEA